MFKDEVNISAGDLNKKAPLSLPTRLICYAWGEKYIMELLSLTMPALLAPGNLPHVASEVSCEVVVLSQEAYFPRFRADPTIRSIEQLCPVRLVSLDDLIPEPDKYGIALTHVLHRGFSDLGPAMTDTWLMFLNADFVLADGSLRNLLRYLRAGERLVASPSYCVNSEAVAPHLRRRIDPQTRALALTHREMATLILHHRHNTIRGKTVNQSTLSFRYMDQFYWAVDDYTLLGHQMPIAIVGMRPERYVAEPNSYWDHGLMREFTPTAEPFAIGDSDEFLMLELRGSEVAREHLCLGWPSPVEIARALISFLTAYQRDMARYPLTLHSRDLPEDTDSARRELRDFVDKILSHTPVELPSHLDHPQWNYHRSGLLAGRHQYLSNYFGTRTETEEPPTSFGEFDRIWWRLDGLKKSYQRRLCEIQDLRAHQRAVLDMARNQLQKRIARESEKLAKRAAALVVESSRISIETDTTSLSELESSKPHILTDSIPTDSIRDSQAPLGETAQVWLALQRQGTKVNEQLDSALKAIESCYQSEKHRLDAEFVVKRELLEGEYNRLLNKSFTSAAVPHVTLRAGRPCMRPATIGNWAGRLTRHVYHRMLGSPPRVNFCSPYWAPYQHLIRSVKAAAIAGANDVLIVTAPGVLAGSVADHLRGMHAYVALAEVLNGNLAGSLNRQFDLCICELPPSQLEHCGSLFKEVAPFVRKGGRVVGFCPNLDAVVIPVDHLRWISELAEIRGTTRVYAAGSEVSARILRYFRRASSMVLRQPWVGPLAPVFLAFVVVPVAILINLRETAQPLNLSRLSSRWTSITIEVLV